MDKPTVINLAETASKYEAVVRQIKEYLDSHFGFDGNIRIDLTNKAENK